MPPSRKCGIYCIDITFNNVTELMTRNRNETEGQRGQLHGKWCTRLLLRRRDFILVLLLLAFVGYLLNVVNLSNRQSRELSIQANHRNAKKPKSFALSEEVATKCTFCDGDMGIPNLDLADPRTGGT